MLQDSISNKNQIRLISSITSPASSLLVCYSNNINQIEFWGYRIFYFQNLFFIQLFSPVTLLLEQDRAGEKSMPEDWGFR